MASDFTPTWAQPTGYDSSGAIVTATTDWLQAYAETPEQAELRALAAAVRDLAATRAPMSGGASRQRERAAAAGLPELLTAAEAADVLRTSRRNLARWVSTGRLRAVKGGAGGSSRVLIPRAAVVEFLAALEVA